MMNKLDALMKYKPGGQQAELFEQKLQKQTAWDKSFCIGAINEYKRFVYLASISDYPITPSTIVDEVWHLHLTFSRCYWEEMCANILEYRLHHDPAVPDEQRAMNDQYMDTHALYKKHFHEAPPRKYWPVKPAPAKSEKGSWLAPVLAAIMSMFIGATAMASDSQSGEGTSFWFWLAVAVFIFWIMKLAKGASSSRRYRRRSGGAACSSYGSGSSDHDPGDGGGSSCGSSCGGGGCGGG